MFDAGLLRTVALEQTAGELGPDEAIAVTRSMVGERRVLTLEGGRMTTLAVRAQEQAIERRARELVRARWTGCRRARARHARAGRSRSASPHPSPREQERRSARRDRARSAWRCCRPRRHREGCRDRRRRARRADRRPGGDRDRRVGLHSRAPRCGQPCSRREHADPRCPDRARGHGEASRSGPRHDGDPR